jgi:hypothetical protein
VGYSLILGGALGNVVDRVLRGSVVDFLDFHWQLVHWPGPCSSTAWAKSATAVSSSSAIGPAASTW